MALFKKSKKQDPAVEYTLGYTGRIPKSIDDASVKRAILPISKKIYLKVKEVLNINRNYEIIEPPDALATIAKAFKVEGYLRRGRDRYVELIWKNGFKFTGRNQKAREYIERRFNQIALVTGQPTEELFDNIAAHLVLYYNVFVIKIRNQKASGGRFRRTFYGKELRPTAGYFVVEPYRMLAKRDKKNGRIMYWEHFDEKFKVKGRYIPEDVIHISLNKNQNEIFGTPAAINVLDDIRALRRMEENVEILVFQHAIPLYQYKVGTETEGPRSGEVDAVQARIDNMVVHGMLVTDGRHDISAVGVRGAALDVDKYLEYFRERIMVGIGHSAASMGLGQVSRSSAGTVSKQVLDAADRYQRRIKSYVEQFMIKELLEEGSFDTFDPENMVHFFIPEIDLDDRVRREFHISSMWQANLLSHDEARMEIGRDPMDATAFDKTFFKLISWPQVLAKLGIVNGVKVDEEDGMTAEQENKEIPVNQYGPKRRSGPAQRGVDADFSLYLKEAIEQYSEIIHEQLDHAALDIQEVMDMDDPFTANIKLSESISIEKTSAFLIDVFAHGVKDATGDGIFMEHHQFLATIHDKNFKMVTSLFSDINDLIAQYPKEDASYIVFDGMKFKIDLLSSWMVQKAYWLGYAIASQEMGQEKMRIVKDGMELSSFDLTGISFDGIYPTDYSDLYQIELLRG